MESNSDGGKVVFEQGGVYIHHASPGRIEALCGGKLRIVEKETLNSMIVYLEWFPTEETEYHLENDATPNDTDWAVVSTTVGYKVDKINGADAVQMHTLAQQRPLILELADLRSFKFLTQDHGWEHIAFIQKDGHTCPTLHFHAGGLPRMLAALRRYVHIKQSRKEPTLHLMVNRNADALERSFTELQIFEDQSTNLVTKFFDDPYTATFSGFSKVTNLFDYLVHGSSHTTRPDEEMVEILHSSLPSMETILQDDQGFEVISCPEPTSRPEVKREATVTVEEWTLHVDAEGRVIEFDKLKGRIFRGGLDACLRQTVWKYLLGYFDCSHSTKELHEFRKQKVDDYYRMKLQWKSMSSDQEKRFADLRERRNIIDKDVTRTDRVHPFFSGENNKNVQLLYDVLMTYCMYNFDLGYVQGMSDLLSPILVVMENEVDSFWCFVGFMERMCHNFEMDQQGIRMQLQHLHTLLHCFDRDFNDYLESHDCGNLYFCFRWLLIWFKREFNFGDVMRLWEVLWTDLPCKNFHLLFSLAILEGEKHMLMENKFGFTEILKHVNDMSQRISLENALCKAEAMFIQLKESTYLVQSLRDIIGLPPLPSPPPVSNHPSEISAQIKEENGLEDVHSDIDAELRYQMGLDMNFL